MKSCKVYLESEGKMEMAYVHARTQLGRNTNHQKKYYDIKSSGETFEKGDFVWFFRP